MKQIFNHFFCFFIAYVGIVHVGNACTNFLITSGATANCGNMISYSADSHQLYGCLSFYPCKDWVEGQQLTIYDWDSGKMLGSIPQVSHTYNVVGNINEYQVSIAETTYGGLEKLACQDGAILDYGSLIYIALQRSKTAREAIRIMAQLTDLYGYASEGESFSIADKNEVWIMEVIGKGNFGKGMVWVARRVPAGYVCAHANQARITTFEFQKKNRWNDPKADTFNSQDVVSFAIENGFYSGSVSEFSFSDVYNPITFDGARFCEIRVWAFFNMVAPNSFGSNPNYWNYAKGDVERAKQLGESPLTPQHFATNRLPLWIKPDKKLCLQDVFNGMRDHLEGTELDMSLDFGAGPFHCPYRMRPLTFEVDGKTYLNERATATQQTGFVFVSQLRNWLPDFLGGIIWFGTDDAASSVLSPFYCSINKIPFEYSQENGSMLDWGQNSSFWINNLISNFAYTRYCLIHPEIEKEQHEHESFFIEKVTEIDAKAAEIQHQQGEDKAIDFLSDFCCSTASNLVKSRKEFFIYLFMKYMDGNVKHNSDVRTLKDNGYGKNIPLLSQPGYGEQWQKDLINKTGEKLLYRD